MSVCGCVHINTGAQEGWKSWVPQSWSSRNCELPGVVGAGALTRVLWKMGPEEEAEKPVKTKTVSSSNGGESSSRSAEKRSAEDEAADLPTKPTKMSKFGFAIGSQTARKASAISIRLGASKPKETVPTLAPKTLSVAAAFNEDEDSEPEEMPPEAKMRMKNIGRDTPTSAGPNSFNKGKHGFSDNQKLWERNIKSHLGNVHDQDN